MSVNHDDDRAQSFMPLTKDTMVGHYRIVEKIGAGGMGEVYLAEDTKLKRQVALKFLPAHLCNDEDCRNRFKREAQATAALKHPNIVTIHEVSEYNERPFMVMEHVNGKSLRDKIKEKKLTINDAISLTMQICAGLSEAHEAGIVHRDIKPSNILLDKNNQPIILDFGLATIKGAEKLTKTGSTLGTVGYLSPEQARGEKADKRSDLFSVGVILYELITGRQPFYHEYEAAIINAILHEAPEPMSRYKSGVAGELQQIVNKALEKNPEHRYQTAVGMLADLKRLAQSETKLSAHWWNRYIVTGTVLALIIVLLVIKPWKFETSSRQEAIAQENRLAIMYFNNFADQTDSLKLGEIVSNLLITDLSESEYVQVVSSQRIYDILRQFGQESEKKVSREVASKVAKKANARWMLTGNIIESDTDIILTSQIIDVVSGDAIASQRIAGQSGDRIFSLIDSLTVEIKKDLSLPHQALEEKDRPIMEATTKSIEAYRYYMEGVEFFNKEYRTEAEESFRRALECDSTMASAYYWLAKYVSGEERDIALANAIKYSDKASHKEKLYIEAAPFYYNNERETYIERLKELIKKYPDEKFAAFWIGTSYRRLKQYDSSIFYHNKVLELDPYFKLAYNGLAYTFKDSGNFEKAIWSCNKYIEIAPNEPNPYDSRGEVYAYFGHLDLAIESFKLALEVEPSFPLSVEMLGKINVLKREYAEAEDYFRKMLASVNRMERANGRFCLSLIPSHQGKFKQALGALNVGIETDSLELQDCWQMFDKIGSRINIYLYILQNYDSAKAEINRAKALLNRIDSNDIQKNIYINGVTDILNAHIGNNIGISNLADYWNNKFSIMNEDSRKDYLFFRALTEIEKNNYDSAIVLLNNGYKIDKSSTFIKWLGICSLKKGGLGDAVSYVEKYISQYDTENLNTPMFHVLSHYWLGQAYEQSGWNDKAIKQYGIFLDIWKNADAGLEPVEDAKRRLARLKGST